MPDLLDLVTFHSGQVRNLFILFLQGLKIKGPMLFQNSKVNLIFCFGQVNFFQDNYQYGHLLNLLFPHPIFDLI